MEPAVLLTFHGWCRPTSRHTCFCFSCNLIRHDGSTLIRRNRKLKLGVPADQAKPWQRRSNDSAPRRSRFANPGFHRRAISMGIHSPNRITDRRHWVLSCLLSSGAWHMSRAKISVDRKRAESYRISTISNFLQLATQPKRRSIDGPN